MTYSREGEMKDIEHIDVKRTFELVLSRNDYCYCILKSLDEELSGKPLPVIPEDNMEFILWHHRGLVEYSDIPFQARSSVTPEMMMPFVKLPPSQQKRVLYRASILCVWLFDGLFTPFKLIYKED